MNSNNRQFTGARWAWAALIVVGLSAVAQAEGNRITIREEAYVKGPNVRLGDVADIEGENKDQLAEIELTPAANPGDARRINAALVRTRLDQAGINAEDVVFNGHQRTLATTLHLDITKEMITESLRRFVETEMPWNLDDATVDIVPPGREFVVPDGEVTFRWRPNPQYNYLGNGAFRGEVLVNGRTEQTFFAKADVEAYEEVVVAARNIERDTPLNEHNTRLEKRAMSESGSDAYFSVKELNGFVTRSSVFPGQVITSRKVKRPQLVERNQLVQIETRVGNLVIQSRAQAMDDGAAGDPVPCRNPRSKEEFVGVLRSDGVVVVE